MAGKCIYNIKMIGRSRKQGNLKVQYTSHYLLTSKAQRERHGSSIKKIVQGIFAKIGPDLELRGGSDFFTS